LETIAVCFSNVWKILSQRKGAKFAKHRKEVLLRISALFCAFAFKVGAKMNLFEKIPENAPEELFDELLLADGVRIERIVSFGQNSPEGFWYDQPENEWVVLLEGAATIRFEQGTVTSLIPGDYLNIPAGCRHRVEKTAENGRTVWVAIFYKSQEK
jgi:cupin 2 domain-containing protein